MVKDILEFWDWKGSKWQAALTYKFNRDDWGGFVLTDPYGTVHNSTVLHFISDIGELWKAQYRSYSKFEGCLYSFVISRAEGFDQNLEVPHINIRDWENKKWQVKLDYAMGWTMTPK